MFFSRARIYFLEQLALLFFIFFLPQFLVENCRVIFLIFASFSSINFFGGINLDSEFLFRKKKHTPKVKGLKFSLANIEICRYIIRPRCI
jgi:hypothetical protein